MLGSQISGARAGACGSLRASQGKSCGCRTTKNRKDAACLEPHLNLPKPTFL